MAAKTLIYSYPSECNQVISSLPDDRLRKYPVPAETSMHRTIHCDSTLPHVQGKLHGGLIFEGMPTSCTDFLFCGGLGSQVGSIRILVVSIS